MRTLEEFHVDLQIYAVYLMAMFVFTSIHPAFGVGVVLLYSLIMSVRLNRFPTVSNMLFRMAIIALCHLSLLVGGLLVGMLLWVTLKNMQNESSVRAAYRFYTHQTKES